MMWYAINRNTHRQYGPYTDQYKNAIQGNPATNRFNWKRVSEVILVETPTNVKPAQADTQTKKRKTRRKSTTQADK